MSRGTAADMQPASQPNASDPAAAGPPASPVVTPGQRAAQRVQEARAQARKELLAGLDEQPANDKPAATPPAEDVPAAKPVEAAPQDEDEDDEAAAAAPAGKADPETEKRLAAIQKQEARAREKLAAERQKLEADRAAHEKAAKELEAARKELADFAKLRERARLDPVAALKALGIADPTDLEYAAKQAYAATKADPSNKEAAARVMRERERDDSLESLRAEVRELREARETEKQQAIIERRTNEIVDGYVKAASADDAPPLVKLAMTKNATATRARLMQTAMALAEETGDVPDAADVFARYEKTRRAELEELGIDPDSLLKTNPKKNAQEAEKKNAAPTLSNDLAAQRLPRARAGEREERAEVRKLLESGQLD